MRRRDFIAAFGGAAAWPALARAQQADRFRRIGVLMSLAEGDTEGQQWLSIFRQSLGELSWVDGRNLSVQHRWAAGKSVQVLLRAWLDLAEISQGSLTKSR
jgi:putative ABC transport system substrate-binding protein